MKRETQPEMTPDPSFPVPAACACLLVTGLLIVLTLAIVFYVYQQEPPKELYSESKRDETSSETTSNHEFADPAGYVIPVPDGWAIQDHTKRDQLIRADIVRGESSGVQVRLQSCGDGRFQTTSSVIKKSYQEDMARHWGGTGEVLAALSKT